MLESSIEEFKRSKDVAKNIWIVDHDSALRSTLTRQLEIWGFNITSFSSTKDAFQRIKAESWPDVIIHETDFSVDNPRNDQFELLSYTLKAQSSNKFCYFVYLVTSEQEDESRLVIESGAHEVIEKPIRNLEAFRSRIESFMRYVNIIRTIEDKNTLLSEQFEKLATIHEQNKELLYTVDEAFERKNISDHLGKTLIKNLSSTQELTAPAHEYFKSKIEPIRREKQRLEEEKKRAKSTAESSVKKKRVLIADDNKTNRKLLVSMLKKQFNSVEVANGQEAIDAFATAHKENQPFHLVMLDIVMPEVTGREALVAMRSLEEKNKVTPQKKAFIAMMTSLDDRESMVNSHQEGCNQYVIKPFSKAKLDKILQKL